MKKITLLLFCFAFTTSIYAQEIVFEADFTDEDFPGWAFYDEDGDGNNWGDLLQIGDGAGGFVTPPSLISRSWQGQPLAPDNWAVSPAIDLSTAGGTINIEYTTQVAAQDWDQETYSVYVTTTDDIDAIKDTAPIFTTTLGDGAGGNPFEDHVHDISSFAGESEVYITFRHFDTVDMDFISVQNLVVTSETLSSSQFVADNNFVHYVNNNMLNLESSTQFQAIEVFDMSGRSVLQSKLDGQQNAQVDINILNQGVYVGRIHTENGVHSFKFAR